MLVLAVNPGSSSLKLSVLDDRDTVVTSGEAPWPPKEDPAGPLEAFLAESAPVDAAAVRVVHGGPWFATSVVVDEQVDRRMAELVELAPLHNPQAVAAISGLRRLRPGLPVVACFDTAFHRTLPGEASAYAVPADWGIRRYGFHGLSHAYASRRAAVILGRPLGGLRTVTCHLGSGSSLAAVAGGVSVDTTMGYTPLEGQVMATRSGSVDPGALLAVQRRLGLSPQEMEDVLYRRSGLLALAGTADMRQVLAGAAAGRPDATLALGVFLHRLRAGIAAMAAALGGLDALVFTGGIGERAATIRWDTAEGLGWLGVALDPGRNRSADSDADISAAGAAVATVVVTAREDLEMVRDCRRLLAGA